MHRQIGYADALKILGAGHTKTLAVIDRLLGGAIMAASAVTGQIGLLELLGARDELVSRSASLLSNFGQRVRGARGKSAGPRLFLDTYSDQWLKTERFNSKSKASAHKRLLKRLIA